MDKPPIVKIDESFKFEGTTNRAHYETEHYWAELRILGEDGDYFIDVLTGKKGEKEAHSHMKINPDQSVRFFKSRGKVSSLSRRIESKLYGLLEDKSIVFNPEIGKINLAFRIEIDEPSRTIKVLFSESGFGEKYLPYQTSTKNDESNWTSSSR
jgi:hypothetical protein